MRFMDPTMVYDFIKILHIKGSYSTEYDYFQLISYLLQFIYYKDRIESTTNILSRK
jgi:hypothetical protein